MPEAIPCRRSTRDRVNNLHVEKNLTCIISYGTARTSSYRGDLSTIGRPFTSYSFTCIVIVSLENLGII